MSTLSQGTESVSFKEYRSRYVAKKTTFDKICNSRWETEAKAWLVGYVGGRFLPIFLASH